MSYTMMNKIRQDRIAKSLTAYDKYVERNGVPTAEDMQEFWVEMCEKTRRSGKLYWWALKVYNGFLHTTENRTFWN